MNVTIEARNRQREELVLMTERLIREFAAELPAGTVMRCVARCREQLQRSGIREGLIPATEAAVRRRLARLIPAHTAHPAHAAVPRQTAPARIASR